jgi:D-alanyl-D-alanine dipeptidase
MIFSSLCFVFFIRKAPRFNFRAFQIMAGRDYWEQVILTDVMERNGFLPFATEWWHFDSSDCSVYPVLDVDPFGMPLP